MLKIRLQRTGRKHEPAFRLVLTDSKNSTKSGRFKEILGAYDPRKTDESLKEDRIKYWMSVGAKPTGTVHNLLVDKKIIEGKKINVLPKKTPIIKEAPVESTESPADSQADKENKEESKSDESPAKEEETKEEEEKVEESTSTPKEDATEVQPEEDKSAEEASEPTPAPTA